MGLIPFDNGEGLLITPFRIYDGMGREDTYTGTTLNAAGESCALIGQLHLPDGPGTSKTLSAAGGGKIAFVLIGTVTFVNVLTNVRVGINDLQGAAGGGLEDGTHDVYADLVPLTDTLAVGVNNIAMDTGSKTLTHGDKIAIVVEMTARAGTDSIQVARRTHNWCYPFCSQDQGSGPLKSGGSIPLFTITFDDGTVGWLAGPTWAMPPAEASAAINSGTTPDELAMIFRVPVPMRVGGLYVFFNNDVAVTDDFEVILYSDPLGTPVAERTVSQDCDLIVATGQNYAVLLASTYDLEAGVDYAVAVRPTTANSFTVNLVSFGSGNAALRGPTLLGTNWYQAQRTDQSGAFGSSDTTKIPMFGIFATHVHEASYFAGGAFSYTGVHRS